MRLERHVGGLGKARQRNYLESRGWRMTETAWTSARSPEPVPMARALHIQLTADLTDGLAPHGWKIADYSPRGYARMVDPLGGSTCSLPGALRRQARREGRPVRELTYALFLGSVV